MIVDGRRMPYLKGQKVDPADVMPDGEQFENIDEFKQLLLKDKDQLARALTEKLLTYATGARAAGGRQGRDRGDRRRRSRQELRLADAGPRDRAERAVSEQVDRSD